MGLTNCPKCGDTISEKATVCPHCKSKLSLSNLIMCEDCETEYDSNLPACPKCGCPKPIVNEKAQKKKHKSTIFFITLVVLVIMVVLGCNITQKAKEAEYYSNMETVSYTMINGAAEAETAGNLIKRVWYNAIYKERDAETDKYTMENGKFVDNFNNALANLFADEDFITSISEIETNQFEVTNLMKSLKNPPKKYEEAYMILEVFYDDYLKLTISVTSPTGSLQTFSEDFNTCVLDTVNSYEKVKLYLD